MGQNKFRNVPKASSGKERKEANLDLVELGQVGLVESLVAINAINGEVLLRCELLLLCQLVQPGEGEH